MTMVRVIRVWYSVSVYSSSLKWSIYLLSKAFLYNSMATMQEPKAEAATHRSKPGCCDL